MLLKEKVLSFLKENTGKVVSGGVIAERIEVTRTAVWKAVKQLRKDGYFISSYPNKGYILSDTEDALDEPYIRKLLKTEYLGRKIDVFKTIDSTNTFAKGIAKLDVQENENGGEVVISEMQTGGRGRSGAAFYSPKHAGLYMSAIIRPQLELEKSLLITSAAAVAVCEAIEQTADIECSIKWVNDIYFNGKKLCGILSESSVSTSEENRFEYCVVGFGVNVNNDSFPKSIADVATSVYMASGRFVERSVLAAAILNAFEKKLALLETDELIEELMAEYRRRSCVVGEKITVTQGGGGLDASSYNALCLDIDGHGRLLIKKEDGETHTLSSGTIRICSNKKSP